ncbi:MAG: cytidine deaminase [Acidobacteriaceae bacterium]|nr:cytidine deaminase [Acidobacteriaceae bacterium]
MTTSTPQPNVSEQQLRELTVAAEKVAANAHAPYSSFRVGAALLLESGEVFTGCNVENSSFRLTSCAEQVAIGTAVSALGPGIRIRAVVVVNLNGASCSPCGACRQTLLEFGTPQTLVAFPDKGVVQLSQLHELIPFGFALQ